MDWALVLVCALLMAAIAVPLVAVLGTVDALVHSAEVWELAGFRRRRWIWQAVGMFCAPLAAVYSGVYFVRVRPRLRAVERARAIAGPFGVGGEGFGDLPARGLVAGGESLPARVRIRLPFRVAVLNAAPLIVIVVMNTVFAPTNSQWQLRPGFWIAYVLLFAAELSLIASFGVTLTAQQAIMHGLRRRRLRWHEVVAVTEDRSFGARYVRIWMRDGRSYRLRAPCALFLGIGRRKFEANFHVIGRWWLAHSGNAPAG